MGMLKNYNLGKNKPYCKLLEYMYKQQRTCNTEFNRLLATYERQRELKHTMLREKLPEKINMSHNISAYSHVKKNKSNNIDVYMKNYKRRYGKKKGLSKLDCYYENKVFGKFNNICDIAKKMQYEEKRSKKFFLKNYGIGLILFALIPILGLIFPILFGINRKMPGILGFYTDDHFNNTDSDKSHKTESQYLNCSTKWIDENKTLIENFEYANMIFSIIMVSIVILFIIYILIKVIKYEKIKSGIWKMNMKEYCRFCKNIFI
ncbi:Plasmodium exported protein, unknown function [Plasmodium vivax]|uniref:Variable surface protein n=1 Tax=Plasmodium vivax TaxID=5855 RepID=A0A565A411_PLAVI|nr:Plasmodium exported protein, unknown function [Plasmodium vivax]